MGHAYIYTDGGNSWAYITDAVNSGNISGNEYVGGVVGFFEKNTNSSFHGTGDSSGIFDSVTTGTVSATANYGDIAGQANILIQ